MAEETALLPGTLDVLILKSVSLAPEHGYGVLIRIRADHRRRAPRRTRRVVSGPRPPRASRPPGQRMGHVRQQPARQVPIA